MPKLSYVTWLMLLAGLSGSTSGCVGSKTTRCSWGAFCPAGTICDESRNVCVAPGQVEVCRGVDDGTSCSYPGAPLGVFYCREGMCVLAVWATGSRAATRSATTATW